MTARITLTIFLLLSVTGMLSGQDTWYGSTTGIKSVFNPAFSGVSGRNEIRISQYSFLPGGGYGLVTFSAMADSYVPYLHGGLSAWITDDLTGSVTSDLRSGIGYSYHFRAGERLFVTAGLSASVIHIGIDRSKIVFPDNIDPFTGQVNSADVETVAGGISRFDAAAGMTVSSGNWYGGFAVSHLTMPYLSDNRQEYNRLHRKFVIDAGTSLNKGTGKSTIIPSAVMLFQGKSVTGCAGITLCKGELNGGLSMWMVKNGFAAIQPSVGWRSQSLSAGISYSYNILNHDLNIPETALVRVSVSFFFNNVEKREPLHVIMLPEL